jgi:Protein of unknown function (DUF3662)
MGVLSAWERAVEQRVGAIWGRLLDREPVELLDALCQECESQAVVCSESRVMVPNAYDVQLADVVHDRLGRHSGRVGQALTDRLARYAESKGYELAGPLTVRVGRSSQVPNGRYRVASTVMTHVRAAEFPHAAG